MWGWGVGGGGALSLGVGRRQGGRNDRGDSLPGHSQWEAPQAATGATHEGESIFPTYLVDDVREPRSDVGFGDGGQIQGDDNTMDRH